jgi:hypothetical protein
MLLDGCRVFGGTWRKDGEKVEEGGRGAWGVDTIDSLQGKLRLRGDYRNREGATPGLDH